MKEKNVTHAHLRILDNGQKIFVAIVSQKVTLARLKKGGKKKTGIQWPMKQKAQNSLKTHYKCSKKKYKSNVDLPEKKKKTEQPNN